MAPTVLVTATDFTRNCPEAKRMLRAHGLEVIENDLGRPMTHAELRPLLPSVVAVIAGVDDWSEEIISAAPMLKVIARFGVGVDNIDVAAAARRGIIVTNAKGMNSSAVAELTLGLILALLRRIPDLRESLRDGRWERSVGKELSELEVGLLGFGEIAQRLAQLMGGFGCRIRAWDKYPAHQRAKELSVEMTDAETVLASSDVVVTLLPSLPETRHFMDERAFARMRRGSYFVNTARGALVDEAALLGALDGHLAGAALDVFEREPVDADHPLARHPHVVATPHTAAETHGVYARVGVLSAQAVIDVLGGTIPRNVIEPLVEQS